MTSTSPDAAAVKRTFANVAASASIKTQPMEPMTTHPNHDEPSDAGNGASHGTHVYSGQSQEFIRINPAIPRQLSHVPIKSSQTSPDDSVAGPKLLVQSPGAGPDSINPLCGPLPSAVSDENSTQLSSSDSSAKPPSLDGKSVASATTFAMDEKESLRPDDSASVKAIEDEDLFSPPGSATIGSRIGSETGARAFRDQLQEITSMGPPSRPSITASGPDTRSSPNQALIYNSSTLPDSSQLAAYAQPSPNLLGKPTDFPPDPKLMEALSNPRDRIWVLKLEQDIIDFVKDSKEPFVDLPQCNSFYRMLAHKLADYYLLGHAVDNTVTAVRLYRTPTCRIAPPLTALTTPSTASNTPPPPAPQVKILRRGGEAPMSKTNSEAGDSDGDKNKTPLTREEREQRYEEARLRIMGSAKPEADASIAKEKDESRSSSVTGKKKPKKQRTDSEDGFDPRSAYSSYPPGSSYAQSGTPDNNGAAAYYPTYTDGGNGSVYSVPNAYAPQTYNAVYGQNMQSQASYPWLQQGFNNYPDGAGQQWDQSHQNANDLASDFQQQMSFQPPNMQGAPQQGPYGYQSQQPHTPSWPQGTPYQSNYPPPAGYQYGASDRPASSASHGSQYGYGISPNQMQGQYMGYNNGAFQRPSFNPQSQAFIPGYPGRVGPQGFMPNMAPNGNGFNAYGPPQPLQRQNSTHSQASSYNGQRPNSDSVNTRGPGPNNNGLTHPLPQPVFSPNVAMPFQNQKQQQQQQQQGVTSRSTSGVGGPNSRSPVPGVQPGESSIAKWGNPASLPAKPPPPANDSFDISRLQGQRAPTGFNAAAVARMPGMTSPAYHALPNMASMRGGQANGPPRGSGQ